MKSMSEQCPECGSANVDVVENLPQRLTSLRFKATCLDCEHVWRFSPEPPDPRLAR